MLPVGNGWVDRFPLLRFLPLPEVIRLHRYHREEMTLLRSLLDAVRKRIADNDAVPPNVVTRLWAKQQEYNINDDELTYLAGSMFGAGSDTTALALGFVMMAAALFPVEWARVKAQVDEVVGHSRLPTFEDFGELPLVSAFILESYRWRPVFRIVRRVISNGYEGTVTLPQFQKLTGKCLQNGYLIPAGTTVIGNTWSIMRDPESFPNPEQFSMDHWLGPDGKVCDELKVFGFGYGRRVCPGQHIAERSLFINTALMSWAFDFLEDPSAPIDSMGFIGGGVVRILPYKVIIQARQDRDDIERLLKTEDVPYQ
ncbi:hypothetical protein NLI96_g1778 [Meripilus lineatus]|uniref:Cytochrome P450 n=1 Tax=Meripilus lineatus TaxID=2056292 RepID=A0AAD5V9H9_9APHY|nr:hypothetical protein NLI96_g1778 [Physisporinus lineatus]